MSIGWVYVDFYLFGFTVYFGSNGLDHKPIPIDQFVQLLQQPGGQTPPDSLNMANSQYDLSVTLVNGSIPELNQQMHNADGDADHVWHVRAGQFQFRVDTKFAYSEASIHNQTMDPSPYPVYSNPMWISKDTGPIKSDLTVDISGITEPGYDWQYAPQIKMMPSALWGACKFPIN
jgi:hypothetical protein